MRIYLPATLSDLSATDGITARAGHTVTPALKRALGAEDSEEAEHGALLLAAADSLALLATAAAPPRRVVVAAEIDPLPVPAGPYAAVAAPNVPWRQVVSFHIDDAEDGPGRRTIEAARGGDEDAAIGAAELDLLWYDVTERAELLGQLS